MFGDFLGAGRRHLEAAVTAEARQGAHLADVVPSLQRLVTVMAQCFEDLAPCDEIEAASRTDLDVWERAVIDAGTALRIAADCLRRSTDPADPGQPAGNRARSPAGHLDDAASRLTAGRDLLRTHILLGPDGIIRDQSGWAAAVTSLSVLRGIASEMAHWSARLAPYTASLAVLAPPHISRRMTGRSFVVYPREDLASASQWLRAAGAALGPALDADAVRPADTELLCAIPAAVPPQRQPADPAGESVAELCRGISVSASRLRAAGYRSRDRAGWSPDVTSGGWQWMAQAAAVTSHLSELALRSLAARAGQLAGLPVTGERLDRAAESMVGMREAWQRVDLMWNAIVTERRSLPTPAMSEAGDLLLRMGRLVWDNPQWTPARAHRGPRRTPAALAPRPAAFTAVVSAAHEVADALARVAITDITTVQAAARNGRLYVPTRSLPARYDVPRAFAPAPAGRVLEAKDAYHDAADASIRAATDLDEIAIAIAAPTKALALARAAAPVQTRRRGGHSTWPDEDGSYHLPRAGESFAHSRAGTGLPGPVEQAVRARHADDPVLLLRAVAIDNAARQLIGLADNGPAPPEPGVQDDMDDARHSQDAVRVAAQSFPDGTVLPPPAAASSSRPASRPGSPSSRRAHLRKG